MTPLKLLLAAALCVHCSNPDNVLAAPIRFELWGEGWGNVQGNDFSGPFKITAFGDTANREIRVGIDSFTQKPFTSLWIVHDSAEISIANLGTFKYTIKTRTFASPDFGTVGFSRGGPFGLEAADILSGPHNQPSLIDWEMMSSTPEISGPSRLYDRSSTIFTDGGRLQFLHVGDTLKFRATIIPEPATWALLVAGLASLLARRHRNTQSA